MQKYSFSGHDTFACRQFWLKKGYDFYSQNRPFSEHDALAQMGVGRNMVTAIRYWMLSFGLLDANNQTTDIAKYLLADDGKDPYLEDMGSLWLLHYFLVKQEHASIYSLVFNELRKERVEFTRKQLVTFLQKKCQERQHNVTEKSLDQDARVFVSSYLRPKGRSGNLEDMFSALMIDLELLQETGATEINKEKMYKIESRARTEIPSAIVLYCILQENDSNSIAFNTMLVNPHSVGSVFVLNRDGLTKQLNQIAATYPDITFTDDAGIRELQFIKRPDPQTILDNYYAA